MAFQVSVLRAFSECSEKGLDLLHLRLRLVFNELGKAEYAAARKLSPWLNPTSELKNLRGLLGPAPAGLLEMPPVSSPVKGVKNDKSELLQQIDD